MNKFLSNLMDRLRAVKPTRWARFGVVSVIFFAWVAWLGNWWVSLWWLLLIDIYLTGYIPFTWWKKSESKTVRSVMSWVDAIVYALVLVYFVFTFIGQNYQIPSSSLEKTLMTGDYLWVNKMAYGPRVPNTPVHFPLVQNTFPVLQTKSYLEHPQWTYHRLKGLGSVQLGDIVVFNFPAGDTVAINRQNPDIYAMSRYVGEQLVAMGQAQIDENLQPIERDIAVRAIGMAYIRDDRQQFGEVIWRPVDRRENYVKRCVGLPGQRFEIRNGIIYNDGRAMAQPENAQWRYSITVEGWESMTPAQREAFWDDCEVSQADRQLQPGQSMPTPPLTNAQVAKLKKNPQVKAVERISNIAGSELLFPLATAVYDGWTIDNYGPLTIPAKGMTVKLNRDTWPIYGHAIQHYEQRDAQWRDGRAWIDGKPADSYTFTMDYYFMMGDNRHSSLDSRFWGFVPEDHIVGRPEMVLASFNPDGGVRWSRFFRKANPDKK